LPNVSDYSSWIGYDKTKLGMIPFGVSSFSSSWVQSAEQRVGWIYVTNDDLPNPWDTLTPYLNNLASMFATGSTGSSSGGSGSTTYHTLTVKSIDQNGNAINGMWTEVSQGGSVV